MALKDILQEINDDVKDIIHTNFEFLLTDAYLVPNYEDASLTFENGKTKKGKTISTCVLFVDIRNSVSLSNTHQKETMGKLYTAFVKAMVYAVDNYGGAIRNIIGDRLMVVFPTKDCFTKSVECAILMNTIANRIINKHFTVNNFKCGIGIDYGEMLVLKNGVAKHGKENSTYKNLVWIGKPANFASRLTDVANKEIKENIYKVSYKPYNFGGLGLGLGLGSFNRQPTSQPIYQENTVVDTLSENEFAQKLSWNDTLGVSYSGGEFIKFSKNEITRAEPAILITEKVFLEYSKAKKDTKEIKENLWKKHKIKIKDFSGDVYGADLYFPDVNDIVF